MNNNWNRNTRGGQNRSRGYGRGRGSGGFRHKNFRGFHDKSGERSNFESRNFNQQWKQWPKRDGPSKRLSEQDIGVTEYVSDHSGFNGIIKSRFSDFQVSEINQKGEIAKLTDISPPKAPVEDDVVMEDEDLLLNKYNLEILPMETWDNINRLAITMDQTLEAVRVDVTGMSKEDRTKIHDAVKKAFPDIIGSTITENDKKFVVFDRYRKGVRVDKRVKWVWGGEFVHFVVYKENCDTMEAATRIAERLRLNIKPSMIGYAGTKDRRAKTSQWFSLRKVDPRKIHAACADLRDIHVGNYTFSSEHLRLGMLKGNVFRICLRNVSDAARADAACAALRRGGFVNYYGLQRFGSRADVPTCAVGRKLLQGSFQEAIDDILHARGGPMLAALDAYRRAGAAAALCALPRAAPAQDVRVLRALARDPRDLLGALDQVARNSRLLYLHSYQSLIWNKVVSERLRRFPREAVVGDLVALEEVEDEVLDHFEDEDNIDTQNGEKLNITTDEKNDEDKSTTATDTKSDANKNQRKKLTPVKVLTQEDIDSGKYTIFDIVLPLPGNSVKYPPNMIDYYKELLEKDGLKLDMRHKYKSYRLCGGYRCALLRPARLVWRHARYERPAADLLPSDLDELRARPPQGERPDGKYKALILTMSLPTSCYATMALRELLRLDTAGDVQAALEREQLATGVHDVTGWSDATGGSGATGVPDATGLPDATGQLDPTGVPNATGVPDATGGSDAAGGSDATGVPDATGVSDATGVPNATDGPDKTGVSEANDVPDATEMPDNIHVPDAPVKRKAEDDLDADDDVKKSKLDVDE